MKCRSHATGTASAAPSSGEHAPSAAREGPRAACSHHRKAGQGTHLTLPSFARPMHGHQFMAIHQLLKLKLSNSNCVGDPELFAVVWFRSKYRDGVARFSVPTLLVIRSIKSRPKSTLESKLSVFKPPVRMKVKFHGSISQILYDSHHTLRNNPPWILK